MRCSTFLSFGLAATALAAPNTEATFGAPDISAALDMITGKVGELTSALGAVNLPIDKDAKAGGLVSAFQDGKDKVEKSGPAASRMQ